MKSQIPTLTCKNITLTEDFIANECKKKGFYRLPELNEKVYLHFLGIEKIENLSSFYNCSAIWLENNCIEIFENLEDLERLRTIFIQNNNITSFVKEAESSEIVESYISKQSTKAKCFLSSLNEEDADVFQMRINNDPVPPSQSEQPNLHHMNSDRWPVNKSLVPTCGSLFSVKFIDISGNQLKSLAGISIIFPCLEHLIASENYLTELEREITYLPFISVLDVSRNRIKKSDLQQANYSNPNDDELSEESKLLSILIKLDKLKSFMFHGNPLRLEINNYRKKVIFSVPTLLYLDEKPVDKEERRLGEAFRLGGVSYEKEEREKLDKEKKIRRRKNERLFDALIGFDKNPTPNSEDDLLEDVYVK